MIYQGKEVEILSKQTIFGKTIAEVRLLADGNIVSVPFFDLKEEEKLPPVSKIVYQSIAAKILYRKTQINITEHQYVL